MTESNQELCSFCGGVDEQIIAENKLALLLYPRRPIFEHHLLLVPKEHTQQFDQLSDSSLLATRNILHGLVKRVAKSDSDTWLGYNMFSSNGDEAIGQHIPHYHAHIFLRFRDEKQSPYTLLSENRRVEMNKDEWTLNRDKYRELFS